MGLKRRNQIQTAVEQALARYRGERPGSSIEGKHEDSEHGEAHRLPKKLARPKRLRVEWREFTNPPRRDEESFRPGFLRVIARISLWIFASLRFGSAVGWDMLRRRNSQESRAVHLRRTLERSGPTAIKLGQQLSMRLDLLPYTYAHELEKMLDNVPPFPTEQAVALIEETIGGPIEETFPVFDPVPIASASIATVFQALLGSGEKVAIKVRRPGIGNLIAADMRALAWMMRTLELFLLPPGFANQLVGGLRTMLLEELDFVREARYTNLFRRASRKSKFKFFTAPKVYFKYSGRHVLVTEFLNGVFLTEVLGAVENADKRALSKLEELDISPAKVARHLVQINQYGTFESLFFHADIHPANVLVQPGNKLVLIDFGSCGSFTEQERTIWRRFLATQAREDVGGMVQAAIAMLEPLPPIDVDGFKRQMEQLFWKDLFAMKSKHSEWWERTSANLWLDLIRLSRQYHVPVDLNTLRMIRATMLSDTVALRLDRDTDHYKEYRKYMRGAGRRARNRMSKGLHRGLRGENLVELENMLVSASGAIYRIQRSLDTTAHQYAKLQSKASFAVSVMFRTAFVTAGGTLLAGAGMLVYRRLHDGEASTLWGVLRVDVGTAWWFQAFLVIVLLVGLRRLLFRLGDREV